MIITSTQNAYWVTGNTNNDAKSNGYASIKEAKQSIRGFGGCFNELGSVALKTLSQEKQAELYAALFSKDGCNFSFCRVPIGANDFALDWYSCNETDDDYTMENFSLERDKLHLIPYIQKAMEYQPELTLFASPWSPPSWMKTPKVFNHGHINPTPEIFKAYALYFRKFVEGYRAEGITIAQIHIQNEPSYLPKYACCAWGGEDFRKFIADYLAQELDGIADIFLGTMTGPEIGTTTALNSYRDYAGYVLQDEDCRHVLKGVGYQWAGKSAVQQTHDDYPDLELVQTESECGDGKNSWDYALYVFELIHHYFRNGVSSYVYWNMILENPESTWGWKQNSMITIDEGQVIYNPEFYVMQHTARFVQKGAKYLSMEGNWSSHCVAFKNPDEKIVIVTANPYKQDKAISIGGENYLLPAESISTILLEP